MATSSGTHRKSSGTQIKSPGTHGKSPGTHRESPVQGSFEMDIMRSQTVAVGSSVSQTTLDVPSESNRSRLNTCLQSSGDDISNYSFSSIEKHDSLESSCSSYDSNTGPCNLPSDIWDHEIEKYQKDMPPHIRTGYIDVLILYAEEDREEVERFRQHLIKDIKLDKYGPIKTWLYDCEHLQAISGGKMGHLAEGVNRSTYVFMYLTANFVKDKWMELSSESCLMEAIYNLAKMWCVVPVYTQKRSTCNFKIPMGLNTLKGINYYNPDEFYQRGVKKLIAEKIEVRVKKELEHKKVQIAWIEGEKQRVAALIEAQKRLQQSEEGQTQMEIECSSQETKRLIHDGIIPGSLRHCPSESLLLSHELTLLQSASTSSLKSVLAHKPALDDHNGQNCNHYLDQEIKVIGQPLQNVQQQDMSKINMSGKIGTRSPPVGTINNFKQLATEGLKNVDITIMKTHPRNPHDFGSPHQDKCNYFWTGHNQQEHRSNINQQLYQGVLNPSQTNATVSLFDSPSHSGNNYQLLPNLQDSSVKSYHPSGPVTPGATSLPQSFTVTRSCSNSQSGNFPITSSVSRPCMSSHNVKKMPETEKKSVKVANVDATDHETEQTNKPSAVHYCTINVYSAKAVQVGDSNIVQDDKDKCNIQSSNDEDEDHNDDKEEHVTVDTGRQNKHERNDRVMKAANKLATTSSKGHGSYVAVSHREMSSSPERTAVHTAPSTSQKWTMVLAEKKTKQQVTDQNKSQSQSQQTQESKTKIFKVEKMKESKQGAVKVSCENSTNEQTFGPHGDGSNGSNPETSSYAQKLETSMREPESLGFIVLPPSSCSSYTTISYHKRTSNQVQPENNNRVCVIS